jgi:hypothetical protein
MVFAEMSNGQIVFLAVVVCMTLFLLARTSRYFTRPKSPDPSWSSIGRKSDDSSSSDRAESVPQEIAGWEVEMHDFLREAKAEMDSKMRALQILTTEADRAAARLEAAIRGSANDAAPRRDSAPSEPANPLLKFPSEIQGRGIDIGSLPSNQAESLRPSIAPRAEHSSAQAKKEEIYTLADYGMSALDIASRVGHPIGEVELILSLRRKK